MTVSGGEPLYQPEFTKGLLTAAKKMGISTCMETSGFASEKIVRDIAPFVDIFLFDCKQINPQKHRKATGVDNRLILNNLHVIDDMDKKIVLRLPLIPGINDTKEHFKGVGKLADSLKHLCYIEVMPYHPLGLSKAALLQRKMKYEASKIPEPEKVKDWVLQLKSCTHQNVVQALS